MGNCCSCFLKENENNSQLNDHLIRDKYCPHCRTTFLSNYEYNKHIPTCPRLYGDI
jgi:hypothetical protein